MPADSISIHGDPNGRVFGIIGESSYNDEGDLYVKSGSQSDTLNVGWKKIIAPTPTPTISVTPSITPTRTPVATRGSVPSTSFTPTPTPTATPTKTHYPVYTRTPTTTPTGTPTQTPTITPTPSTTPAYLTPLPTSTPTPTNTPSPSVSPSKTLYTLSISKAGNGSVWPYGTGTFSIPYGTNISLDADPDPSNDYDTFEVNGITGAVSSSTIYVDGIYGNCQFIMPSNNCSVTASFVPQPKFLELRVSGSGIISTPLSSGTYPYNTSVVIQAQPNINNRFSHWTFSGTSNPFDGPTTASLSTIHMDYDRIATAYFLALKVVYANVNSSGVWSVSYKDVNGNNQTLSGTTGPQFYNSQISVSCGTEVYSGGGLLDTGCSA